MLMDASQTQRLAVTPTVHAFSQGLARLRRSGRKAKRQPQQPGTNGDAVPRRRLPETGLFADVDPTVEVRPALGFVENPDISKRPGRYQSDFIWNTDWQSQLDREEAKKQKPKEQVESPAPAGGLSLSRMQSLNSLDVDLSEQLKRRNVDGAAVTTRQELPSTSGRRTADIPPTQADSRRWERSRKFSTRAVALADPSQAAELAEKASAEKAEYDRLKLEIQTWTLATSIIGCSAAWLAYSWETAISYGIGAVGSFTYLRMLNRSIDAVAGDGLGGALGQPRLLIPIVLALGYNRWNHLKAEETGILLQLLPMLVGFFTYKVAVAAKQGLTLLQDLADSAGSKTKG